MFLPILMYPPLILPSLDLIQSKHTVGVYKCIGVHTKSQCIPGFVVLFSAVFSVCGKEYQWGRYRNSHRHTLNMCQWILSKI